MVIESEKWTKDRHKASGKQTVILTAIFLAVFSITVCAIPRAVGNVTTVTPSRTNGVVASTSSGAKVLIEFFDQKSKLIFSTKNFQTYLKRI